MFGYATALRSCSQGRAVYIMEPDHFAEVPKSISDDIVSTQKVTNRINKINLNINLKFRRDKPPWQSKDSKEPNRMSI